MMDLVTGTFISWIATVSNLAAAPVTWIVAVFGAIVGSFLNVCILRIPEGTFFRHARSVCPTCGTPVPAWLNIPIFSWFILRGRAACCGARLSFQYPAVEAFTSLMFVVIYWQFPFVGQMGEGQLLIDHNAAIRFGHAAILTCLLIVCSVIDMHHMIIPDVISLPMIAVTPLIVMIHPELTWQSALIGVVAGGGCLYAVAWIYWLIRREVGMGMGDVKLLAGIGGWLGYQAILPTVFYGSILGALFGLGSMVWNRNLSMRSAIPFGPFLAIGALLHLVAGFALKVFLLGAGSGS